MCINHARSWRPGPDSSRIGTRTPPDPITQSFGVGLETQQLQDLRARLKVLTRVSEGRFKGMRHFDAPMPINAHPVT
jgi:hypothetical protein